MAVALKQANTTGAQTTPATALAVEKNGGGALAAKRGELAKFFGHTDARISGFGVVGATIYRSYDDLISNAGQIGVVRRVIGISESTDVQQIKNEVGIARKGGLLAYFRHDKILIVSPAKK